LAFVAGGNDPQRWRKLNGHEPSCARLRFGESQKFSDSACRRNRT
jgi:hypothetical protein